MIAAATFAFSGVVFSQVNHVDMTEGFVALPWMLLATLHIVRDGRWRWSILLGAGLAVVILGGAPEAMLDLTLFVVAYAIISAGVDRQRWWRIVGRGAAGAALGLSLAAIQWLPGLNAIANSQRPAWAAVSPPAGATPRRTGCSSWSLTSSGGTATWGRLDSCQLQPARSRGLPRDPPSDRGADIAPPRTGPAGAGP